VLRCTWPTHVMRATSPFLRVGNYVPHGFTQCVPILSACYLHTDPANSIGWRRAVRGSPEFSAQVWAQTPRDTQTPPTAGDSTGLPKLSPLVGGRQSHRCPGDVRSPKLRASRLISNTLEMMLFSPVVHNNTGGSPGALRHRDLIEANRANQYSLRASAVRARITRGSSFLQ